MDEQQAHTPLTYLDGSPYYFHAAKVGDVAFDMRLCGRCGHFYAHGAGVGQYCSRPVLSADSVAENRQPTQIDGKVHIAPRNVSQEHSERA